MDRLDKEARSRLMAAVKQRDTKPEMLLRHALHRLGYRYRVNQRTLSGSPDLVFRSRRAVIFVNGCFWHDHEGCKYATKPKSRIEFWTEKLRTNRERDRRNYAALRAEGWRLLVVWECALKGTKLAETVTKVAEWLEGDIGQFELP
jgi:DNA mismatch endonuclease (patch repair protein)